MKKHLKWTLLWTIVSQKQGGCMKERQTTICLNELDWQMIDELKPVIGEKTLIAVLRYAIRSLHRNFFGEIAHKRARLDTNKEG